jgi:hypothetical protein
MKKYTLFVFVLLLYKPPFVNAESIKTGTAKAESKVETHAQGGSVTTHIEVEANGEKKVLDSNEEGKNELEVESDSSVSENDLEDEDSDSTVSADLKEKEEKEIKHPSQGLLISFFRSIIDSIKHFFRM